MPKILVIRAEKGKLVESKIVEGELQETIRGIALKALEEWDTERSDFIIIRENRNLEIGENNIQLPIYMISFDNTMIEEDNYMENKIYIITPYVNEETKELLEIEATEITTPIGEKAKT